ncbi:MAG: formylglycine-generating enzyme family protein [Gracilibacteraceae bacterium]|jgi:formylglycine-generating enzyme required for sulfatase activity|nr:formylglycine-generating enzyme family protein [Gracilibacteraceae bacterium]
MSAIDRDALYRQNYDALSASEREKVLRSLAAADPRFQLLRFERFERFGALTETAIFTCAGKEFVFVPGDTVTLGWDSFTEGMDERTNAAMARALAEFEITDIEGFIAESTSPVRQVTIAPMLAEREVGVVGWREVAPDSPELAPLKSEIEQNRKYITPDRGFEIHETLRVSHIDGRQVWEIYDPISLRELIEKTHASGFALPTEDEWEYLCACGKRTLFRWGDSFDFDMKLLHFSRDKPADAPYSLKLPNGFGLSIAYDPYKMEVMENSEYFLKGGDGGCNICGGAGMVFGYFPVSAFFRSTSLSDDDLGYQSDIGGDYTFYRRIVRLG